MIRALIGESVAEEDTPHDADFGHIYFKRIKNRFRGAAEPMSALARCLAIAPDDDTTVVIGTPLYVAFQPPP